MLTVKLYERTGTYVKTLTTDANIQIKSSRDTEIRRTASFLVSVDDLREVKKLGRITKIFDKDGTQQFSGYIDDVRPSIVSDAWVNVSVRDKGKVYKLARFDDDVTYEDGSATSATRSITASSASTEMAAGDEIQEQGRAYGIKLEATVAGITSEVTPDSQSGDPTDGDLSIDYAIDGLSQLQLTFFVDLLAQESIQGFTVTTNGTEQSKQYSADGDSFADFSGTPTGRYLKVVITKAGGPITAGITVTANAAAPASNVETDNSSPWRPDPADLDRQLTLTIASAQVNGLYLKCGVSDLDRETAYRADVEALVSGTWTEVVSDKLLVSGLNEITFNTVTATGIRLTFKEKNAPVAIRYAEIIYVSSIVTIDQLIETILTTEGESDFTLVQETRQVPAGNAITFLAGEEKLKACIDLAASINWEFFYDQNDKPVLRPIRWADPMADDILEITAMLDWSPVYSDAQIYNKILALYEAGDTSLWATATNDSGASSTSTVNLGTRTSPVLRNPLANTQSKLDAWVQEQLAKYSQQAVTATTRIPAIDAAGVTVNIEGLTETPDASLTTINVRGLTETEDANYTTYNVVGVTETYDTTLDTVNIIGLTDPDEYDYSKPFWAAEGVGGTSGALSGSLIDLEPGSIVHIIEAETGTAGLFRVKNLDFAETINTMDAVLEVENL